MNVRELRKQLQEIEEVNPNAIVSINYRILNPDLKYIKYEKSIDSWDSDNLYWVSVDSNIQNAEIIDLGENGTHINDYVKDQKPALGTTQDELDKCSDISKFPYEIDVFYLNDKSVYTETTLVNKYNLPGDWKKLFNKLSCSGNKCTAYKLKIPKNVFNEKFLRITEVDKLLKLHVST